jgi:predicted nucleic acid-binding protein
MNAYADSGLIVKSYVDEENSAEADALLAEVGTPLAYSHFHSLEIPNAIHLKRFRKEITPGQEAAAIRAFQGDIETGRLQRPDYDLGAVFRRAETLSARHSGSLGTRSMDLLHVATALEAGCAKFISFDKRQRKIAAKEGLRVIPRK